MYNRLITLASLMLFAACSSDKTIEEIEKIPEKGTDPLSFTCVGMDGEAVTRASKPLTTGFLVSGYKAYSNSTQQMVMKNYEVEYFTTGTAWDGNVRPYWDYTKVSGQYEKYWDFANFPYRFHAIAPCPTNTTGFTLSDKQLTIPAPYKMQTSINGMVSPQDAEPYLVSQVHRDNDGKDTDIIKGEEINTGNNTKNRYVWMPFHHLNSKVRFGVYTRDNWATANKIYIEDLTINVTSSDFVKSATSYEATGTTSWQLTNEDNAGFKGLAKATSTETIQLLRFDGGEDIKGNDLRDCQGRSSAFWLQCPDGIMQIPQKNINMTVSFRLCGAVDKQYTNVPIKLEDEDITNFDWKAGNIYTYYLVLGPFDKLEITFTATLAPWEDISGSLVTDLEQ